MRIQIAGRQMDVGEALRTRIENELASGVGKYFNRATAVSYTHLRAHETVLELVCRLLLEKNKLNSDYSLHHIITPH